MPWKEQDKVSLREEFVRLANQEGANIQQLCRRYGISRPTGYRWLERHRAGQPLADRPRRPHRSPSRTPLAVEQAILARRAAHPAWGARKLHVVLGRDGLAELPSVGAVHAVLRRHGCIDDAEAAKHQAFRSFEYPRPNALWQMDFKGHFALRAGRCHPLTVLDDHSRFSLGVVACADEQGATVQRQLTELFRRYGLPERMLADNGGPWANVHTRAGHTQLTVWLLRLGVRVLHGRPYHPQTQGKDERFHRTLQVELLRDHVFADLATAQRGFDAWREVYNLQRPHQSLGMAVPADRYQPSPRPYPEALPAIEYGPDDAVRMVNKHGDVSYQGARYFVGEAFRGLPVALRPTAADAVFDVYFCAVKVAQIDQRAPGQECNGCP